MKKVLALFSGAIALYSVLGVAANPFTQAQLLRATQLAMEDYKVLEPGMTDSVSGFKTTTIGNKVQVLILMDADGMNMPPAKYFCFPSGGDLACHFQQ